MIIPSIDIQGGKVVQLIEGEKKVLERDDAALLATNFGKVGEIAVIDIDRARGEGSNEELVRSLLPLAPCRVGGGIRDYETAVRFLDWGAEKIILGSAATPELLGRLPRERLIAALDCRGDAVMTHGWRIASEGLLRDQLELLRAFVSGFLITFIEREGHLGGTDVQRAAELRALFPGCQFTVAGGITTEDEIATLDKLDIDAQVGMALYVGKVSLASALCAVLTSDRADGLYPSVIVDESSSVLGLAYSSKESISVSLQTGRGVYQSRRRGLWEKGASSGNIQDLVRIIPDCDRDALCFVVRQHGEGFCHKKSYSCFQPLPETLAHLFRFLRSRQTNAPENSYTARLFANPSLLRAKLEEEVFELNQAKTRSHVLAEAADVLYFTFCRLAAEGIELQELEHELAMRRKRITRRPGNAKSTMPEKTSASAASLASPKPVS